MKLIFVNVVRLMTPFPKNLRNRLFLCRHKKDKVWAGNLSSNPKIWSACFDYYPVIVGMSTKPWKNVDRFCGYREHGAGFAHSRHTLHKEQLHHTQITNYSPGRRDLDARSSPNFPHHVSSMTLWMELNFAPIGSRFSFCATWGWNKYLMYWLYWP